ncbi:MAG: hypothetical protein C4341_08210 [Armatimonadota bacterium]
MQIGPEEVKEIVAELTAEVTNGYVPRIIVREVWDATCDTPVAGQEVINEAFEVLMDNHPPLVLYIDELLDIYDFDAGEFRTSDHARQLTLDIQARIEDVLKSQA